MDPIAIETHASIASVRPEVWDALVDSPFLEHAFLSCLEETGCVGEPAGWTPAYVTAKREDGTLLGALPLFIKTHSAGEFVFDWGWADAAHRAGIPYYPKAVVAAPLTPVTGSRLLIAPQDGDLMDVDAADRVRDMLIQGGMEVLQALDLSSIHFNFITEPERNRFKHHGFPIRIGTQYHWLNRRSSDGEKFNSFDEFLGEFRSKRRANIRRERRKLEALGVTARVVTGDALTSSHMSRMYTYYKNTVDKFYWGRQYLKRGFFEEILRVMRDRLHFVVAEQDGVPFAGTFNMVRDGRLYGRYWGCVRDVEFAHFEVCMYTPISWCIDHGIDVFEPGAGGEHKFERGFTPTETYSAHFVRHPGLFDAVCHAIEEEEKAMVDYRNTLRDASPLKVPGF